MADEHARAFSGLLVVKLAGNSKTTRVCVSAVVGSYGVVAINGYRLYEEYVQEEYVQKEMQ